MIASLSDFNQLVTEPVTYTTFQSLKKLMTLNNGRELKYYIAPESEGKITVPEILEFMQIQAEHMAYDTAAYSRDYTVGYRDAIEGIYLFIKKRFEEDSKKKKKRMKLMQIVVRK